MKNTFFIAGTDTDAGKTLITEALLICARKSHLRSIAMKPIAAGVVPDNDQGNLDAIKLKAAASIDLSYEQVNPLLLASPIAPHIAAEQENKLLTANKVAGYIRGFLMNSADIKLIEGAGGFLVPLNYRETLADAIRLVNMPIILVIGLKLGCLNHALLTIEAIKNKGLHLAGWVATQIDENMLVADENITTLKNMIPAPCLGIVPYKKEITAEIAAEYLQLSLLIKQ